MSDTAIFDASDAVWKAGGPMEICGGIVTHVDGRVWMKTSKETDWELIRGPGVYDEEEDNESDSK